MKKAKVPSAVAAAVLAVLTLAVFFVLQDYGPVSAVRRFHEALARRDATALQQVVEQPVNDPSVAYLDEKVGSILAARVEPRLARTDRQPGQDDVAVVYPYSDGTSLAIVWIVDRRGSIWKINAQLTAAALYDSLHNQAAKD